MSVAVRTVAVTLVWRRGLVGRGFVVGGFEVRPVSAAEFAELMSGRCTCGCSDGADAVLARYPVGAPLDVVGMEYDFAANVDGRWVPSWAAFEAELDRLDAAQQAVIDAGERPLEALSAGEQFVFGVWAGAQWTLGQSEKPPLGASAGSPVSNQVIAQVIGAADRLIAKGSTVEGFAAGVRAWLLWIGGLEPAIVYPAA